MAALPVDAVVAALADACLNLSLAPDGGLAVAPRSLLTAELRDLVRSNKALLINWLTAANDDSHLGIKPPANPLHWKILAAAYYAHHFNCRTCIAAGLGSRYGQMCDVGMPLWQSYFEAHALAYPSDLQR